MPGQVAELCLMGGSLRLQGKEGSVGACASQQAPGDFWPSPGRRVSVPPGTLLLLVRLRRSCLVVMVVGKPSLSRAAALRLARQRLPWSRQLLPPPRRWGALFSPRCCLLWAGTCCKTGFMQNQIVLPSTISLCFALLCFRVELSELCCLCCNFNALY